MKFTVPKYTKLGNIELCLVEVIDITYCRNVDGYLVTTLFCQATEPDDRFTNLPINDFKEHLKSVIEKIKDADSYMNKLKYAEVAIEVRGDYYYAVKNRYGNRDSRCEMYKG